MKKVFVAFLSALFITSSTHCGSGFGKTFGAVVAGNAVSEVLFRPRTQVVYEQAPVVVEKRVRYEGDSDSSYRKSKRMRREQEDIKNKKLQKENEDLRNETQEMRKDLNELKQLIKELKK